MDDFGGMDLRYRWWSYLLIGERECQQIYHILLISHLAKVAKICKD